MKKIFTATIIILSLIFISCIENPTGLFYSMEKETLTYASQLTDGDVLSVSSMAKKNGNYFIAAGTLYTRSTETGSAWSSIMPSSLSGYRCHKIVELDDIYGIFYHTENLDFRLFKISNSTDPTTETWNEIDISDIPSDESLIDVQASGSRIFLYTQSTVTGTSGYTEYRYSLYSTPDVSLSNTTNLSSGVEFSDQIGGGDLDIDYDGANYWLIAGNMFYTGTSGSLAAVSESSLTTVLAADADYTSQGYRGLICTGTDLYLTTAEGIVLKRNSGGTWTNLTEAAVLSPLYDIKRITTGSIDILLMGSSAGYYELNFNGDGVFVYPENDVTEITDATQFSIMELSSKVITDFFQDGADIFALGYNAGLWINTEDDNGERYWDLQ